MKFHVIIEGDYEVADAEVDSAYEDLADRNPESCARHDEGTAPEEILTWLENITIAIVPA